MRIIKLIETHFWIVLLAGIVLGLFPPVDVNAPPFVPKLLLGMMLFMAFLKIDALDVIENMKNLRLMSWITFVYMLAVPLVFYFIALIFDQEFAVAMLLLTAMPAGVTTPVLTDIARGNIPLSMSLAILTQLVAPFSVPLLFWLVNISSVNINELLILKDIAILVFVPMILSQIIKKFLPRAVERSQKFFMSFNVLILFSFIYITISSQRGIILGNPAGVIWKLVVLYLVFIFLHIVGYMSVPRQNRESRIAVAIGSAYMNNGLALVLAVSYFSPSILILMVLSEFPWSTLLAPFKKVMEKIPDRSRPST
ncbi:MAG: bile acid:sodium symporter [Bacteroidales bacterium]|nr:bile acid:sodium symporter [Bacteroidales bacterium]